MSDIRARLRQADALPVPDLWERINEATPRGRDPEWRRPVALVTALLVAVMGIAAAAIVFDRQTKPAGDPNANGPIVFVAPGGESGPGITNLDLFAVEPDGTDRRRITQTKAAEQAPLWSPDGARVLVQRDEVVAMNGELRFESRLVVLAADGSELRTIRRCERTSCHIGSPAWSHDGSRIAFVDRDSEPSGAQHEVLHVFDVDSGVERQLCRTQECGFGLGQLAWSPDGTRIAMSELGGIRSGPGPTPSAIRVIDVAGGAVRKLTGGDCSDTSDPPFSRCETDGGPAWSPDGARIAFSRSRNGIDVTVMVMNADGSSPERVDACPKDCYGVGLIPLWSPRGEAIAFSGGFEKPEIRVVDLEAGSVQSVEVCESGGGREGCYGAERMVWSPDGRELAFVVQDYGVPGFSASLQVVGRDGSDRRTLAEGIVGWPAWLSERAGESLARAANPASPMPAVPEPLQGEFVLVSDLPSPGNEDHYALYRVPAGGGEPMQLTEPGHNGDPVWSPDGSRVAFWSLRQTQSGRIYVMNADGSGQHPIVSGYGGEPAWSPDGSTIAYTGSVRSSQGGDRATLLLVAAEGGEPRVLADEGAAPSWAPDGRSIVFTAGWDDGGLRVVDLDSGDVRPLIDLPGYLSSPAWSPDGSEIAFTWSTPGGGGDIYAVRPDGSGLRRITDGGGGAPAWSPDGRYLAFAQGSYHGSGIFVIRPDGTGRLEILHLDATISGIDWSGAGS